MKALGMLTAALNVLAVVGAGIWLGVAGQWWAIFVGMAAMTVSILLVSVLAIPVRLIDRRAAASAKRGAASETLRLTMLSSIYTATLMTFWCMVVFYSFMSAKAHAPFVPLALWSYGVALLVWEYRSSKSAARGPKDDVTLLTSFAHLGYLLILVIRAFFGTSYNTLGWVLGGIMVLGVAAQVVYLLNNQIDLMGNASRAAFRVDESWK